MGRGSRIPLSSRTTSLILSGKKRAMIFRSRKYPLYMTFTLRDMMGIRKTYVFTEIRKVSRKDLDLYREDLAIDPSSPPWADYLKEHRVFYIYFFVEVDKTKKQLEQVSDLPKPAPA
ncbi:MAG: hypothetical protein ACP5QH_06115 [Thermoplasmata archaeon]